VLAFVETISPIPIDMDALNRHLADHLAPYKRPAQVTRLEALPMTHSGKVMKRALLEQPSA
jgi:acyl-coenzyme A synthetase/AMP-(fatty) acid ligase